MAKLSIVIFAVLLVSVARARAAEPASKEELNKARAACVESIWGAIRSIEGKYYTTLASLPSPPDEFTEQLFTRGTAILKGLVPIAKKANTVEVTSDVRTAFGNTVNCYKDLARYVRDVTNRVFYGLEALFGRSDY